MSATAEALSRMYPSLAATPSSTNSSAPAASGSQANESAPAAVARAPAADAFKPTHPFDAASRLYPNQTPPPGTEAAKAKAEADAKPKTALVEAVPENIAKLREGNKLNYPAHYDVAMGFSTKAVLSGQLSAEQVLVRNAVAGMATDIGLDAGALNTITNLARATKLGKPVYTESVSDADKADAHALMSRDPRVGAILEHLNIANNGRVLTILAAAAREQRTKGRL